MKVSIKIYLKLVFMIICTEVLSSQIIQGGPDGKLGPNKPKSEEEKVREDLDKAKKEVEKAEAKLKEIEAAKKKQENKEINIKILEEIHKMLRDLKILMDSLKTQQLERMKSKIENNLEEDPSKILDDALEEAKKYGAVDEKIMEKLKRKIPSKTPITDHFKKSLQNSSLSIQKIVVGTGLSTGHIANINLNNTDNNPINFTLPASEIPSDGVHQGFVVPNENIVTIPGNTVTTLPISGYCTNPNLSPPPKGFVFSAIDTWNPNSTLIQPLQDIINVAQDLQKGGGYNTPFSNQPDVEQKVIIQNTFWRYTTPDYNPCSNFKMRYESYTGIPEGQMKATDKAALDYGIGQLVAAIDRTTYGFKKIPNQLFSHSDQLSQFYRLKDALPSNYPEIAKTIHVTGTGLTTGHIANFTITNPTDKLVKIQIGTGSETNSNNPFYIPSDGQYQPYIVPTVPPISVSPGQTEIIELNGFCTDISTPPVPTGVEMPHPSQWIGLPGTQVIKPDPNVVTIPTRSGLPMNELVSIIQNIQTNDLLSEKDCPKIPTNSYPILPGTNQTLNFPIDVEKFPAVGVPLLLDAINKIATEYDRLKEKGIINTPFSGNPEKEREAVIQQTFWKYSSVLEGSPYDKKDFRDNTIRQFEKSGGKQFDQQPQPQQQKLIQGVDDFWNTFEAVGAEAKILSRPQEVPNTPVPDDFWNDLPKKFYSGTQPELIGDKKGKPVAGAGKNNKKTEKKCECGEVTFSLMIWDVEEKPPGSDNWVGVQGTNAKKDIKSGSESTLPEENIAINKNLKKGSKQLIDIRNIKATCPCINLTDDLVKAIKDLETLKSNAKAKIEKAEKALTDLEKDLIEAEKKLAEEKNGKRPNKNTIKTRQEKVTNLQEKIAALRNELETLKKPISEKQTEIDALKSKNHEATDCPVYGDNTKKNKFPDVKVNDKETNKYTDKNKPLEDTRTSVIDVPDGNPLEFTIEIKFYCEGTECKPIQCTRKFKVKVEKVN